MIKRNFVFVCLLLVLCLSTACTSRNTKAEPSRSAAVSGKTNITEAFSEKITVPDTAEAPTELKKSNLSNVSKQYSDTKSASEITNSSVNSKPKTEETTNEEPTLAPWKKAYLELLDTEKLKPYKYGNLALIDNDCIPELVLQSEFMIEGNMLCWIENGKAKNTALGTLGGVLYTEKGGQLCNVSLNHGIYMTSVMEFDGKNLHLIHIGRHYDDGSCTWDDEPVSQEVLDENCKLYEGDSEVEYLTISKVKQLIKSY